MRVLPVVLLLTAVWTPASPIAAADTKPAAPAEAVAAQAPPPGPAVDDVPYSYQTDGRRDPFQSLTVTSTEEKAPRPTAPGIAGIRIDELAVRGIMQSRERLVAMVTGPDKRTYVIHQGDKLADGVVQSINPQGVVLVQDVGDPGAKDKTREVRKLLRTEEKE